MTGNGTLSVEYVESKLKTSMIVISNSRAFTEDAVGESLFRDLVYASLCYAGQ